MSYDPNNNQSIPQVAEKKENPLDKFKQILALPTTQTRLEEMLGPNKAAKYKSTLLQIIAGNKNLLDCEPMSVVSAAVTNASINLEINPMFGYAAIVPFNNTVKFIGKDGCQYSQKVKMATYQVMTKGWTQLAMRSGDYQAINADMVYEDEFKGRDLLSGRPILEYKEGGFRDQGDVSKVIGFFAYFKLVSGAEKVIYWDLRQIETHARIHAKSYSGYGKLPIPKNWKPNFENRGLGWDKNWPAMAQKTVLKQLITRWGPLSTDMKTAVRSDQAALDINTGKVTYVDNMEVDELTGEVLLDYSQEPVPTDIPAENQTEAPAEEVKPVKQTAPKQTQRKTAPKPDPKPEAEQPPVEEPVGVGPGPEAYQDDDVDYSDDGYNDEDELEDESGDYGIGADA